jgi:hypothetical protein
MRFAWSLLLAAATCCLFVAVASARDDKPDEKGKEVTLKGEIMCAKCELKEEGIKKCTTVIVVKEDGKEVTYYLKDKGNKEEYHEEVCGGGRKAGTVKGTVAEKDGKKWITPSKVEYAKK